MALQPKNDSSKAKPADHHPAAPPPATPGVAQPDQQEANQPAEPPAKPERPVAKEEAGQLLRAGHRLRKKGDAPEQWFAATRLFGQLCIVRPLDEATEKEALDEDLVLGDD